MLYTLASTGLIGQGGAGQLSLKARGHGVSLWAAVSISPGCRNWREGVRKPQERQKKASGRGARKKSLILMEAQFGSSVRFPMLISISQFRPKCVTNVLCKAPWPDPLPPHSNPHTHSVDSTHPRSPWPARSSFLLPSHL